MTPDENRIARDMHNRGFIPKRIVEHLGSEGSTITRLVGNECICLFLLLFKFTSCMWL